MKKFISPTYDKTIQIYIAASDNSEGFLLPSSFSPSFKEAKKQNTVSSAVYCSPVNGNEQEKENLVKRPLLPHLLPIKFRTENINRVTFFIMSCLVTIFINILCGSLALACSIKSHKLMLQRTESSKRKARFFGKAALLLNIIGIFTTMITLIVVFLHQAEPTGKNITDKNNN